MDLVKEWNKLTEKDKKIRSKMILTKEVELLINKNNLFFYKNSGYDVEIGKTILIPVSKLSKGSHLKIKVKCDFCDLEKDLSYKNYNKSINTGNKYACSQKCSYKKKSEILIDEEGIENIFQSVKIKEKIKKNNLIKWGVESYTKTNEFKEKYKKTCIDKYGVENPMKNNSIKDKSKDTNLKRWGGTGFESEEILNKIKSTNLKNWGTEIPSKSEKVKQKIKERMLEIYGETHNNLSEEFRKEHFKVSKHIDYIGFIPDECLSLFKCDSGHNFKISSDLFSSRSKSNTKLCTTCNSIDDLKSFKEKEIFEYINSIYDDEIIQSYRDGLEIDIYIPKFKIGFEFNGLIWHSTKFKKDKNYHKNKSEHFKKRGIHIFHIWEDDWDLKRNIIKSQIKNALNLSNKIYGRKCHIKKVEYIESQCFLENNHIQGSYSSIKLSYGLYFQNELVSLMCFDQFEGRKKMKEDEWNVSRFCNKLNYTITGGASKLLKYFLKIKKPNRIISYANKDWSNGNLYEQIGFNKVHETNSDYKYIVKSRRIHKSSFRKSKTGISENNLNIPKIWDCGKIKYELIIKELYI
jgi:hypothetical protein